VVIPSIQLIVGFILLGLGAEGLVRGSSALARTTGIRPVIIALTIVAFGTSAPEFVVSLSASIRQTSDIAVGNIIGSMIANIGLILGISALVRPIKTEFRLLKKEIPILLVAEIVFFFIAINLTISRIEGFILLLGFILFNWYCVVSAKKDIKEKKRVEEEYKEYIHRRSQSKLISITLSVVGIGCLIGGSQLAIKGAISIAYIFEISPFIISASLIALGTSLPELATSVVAAIKGEFEITVGNVLGSNIFNLLLCIGAAALVHPLTIKASVLKFDIIVMLGLTILLGIFMWTHEKITRIEGLILLIIYGGYIYYLFT